MATFIYPQITIDTTGLATEAKQDSIVTELQSANSSLTSLDGKDFATETTLAALNSNDFATETTLSNISSRDFATETTLSNISSRDFATETSLSNLNSKVVAVNTGNVTVVGSALPTGAATESTLASLATEATLATRASEASLSAQAADISLLEARLAGSLVPEEFDYQELTYVAAGNGAGEVETVIYKLGGSGGSTVATLTLAYDAQNRVSSVTRS